MLRWTLVIILALGLVACGKSWKSEFTEKYTVTQLQLDLVVIDDHCAWVDTKADLIQELLNFVKAYNKTLDPYSPLEDHLALLLASVKIQHLILKVTMEALDHGCLKNGE